MDEWLWHLDKLSALADIPTEKREREEHLWKITEKFFESPESFDQNEAALFSEVMEELAYSLERQVREELARRIAKEAGAPHPLILRLAHDEIAVSKPVLRHSPVLTEDDLVEISDTKGQEHLLAISQRMEVGLRLSAVLAIRGDDDVKHHLAKNSEAKLSPDTMGLIAERCRNSPRIQAALVNRQDIPRRILLDLLEEVSETVRDDIRDKIGQIDEKNLDEAIASLKIKIQEGRSSRAMQRINHLEERHALNEQAIVGFLANNEPAEFLLGLARLFAIDLKTVLHIVCDNTGKALALACRAHDFSAAAYKEIASSKITGTSSEPRALVTLVNMYSRINEDSAKRAMQFICENLSGAHGPPSEDLNQSVA